jgi:hypothetical protein
VHLRQILTHIGALPLGKPEVLAARAEQPFNGEGKLVDPATGGYLQDLLTTLANLIQLLEGATGSLVRRQP